MIVGCIFSVVLISIYSLAGVQARDLTSSVNSGTFHPLIAHAHNDYYHDVPLYDALNCGFTSIEADLLLRGDTLYVGHDSSEITAKNTLESLYLEPLNEMVENCGGCVSPGVKTIYLLLDIKSEGDKTFAVLKPTLRRYGTMLTSWIDDKIHERAVTVILSGNRPIEMVSEERERFVALDGRLDDLENGVSSSLFPVISENWRRLFSWRGEGQIPDPERESLRKIIEKAHANGHKIRFWATDVASPSRRRLVWSELQRYGVDYINTDDLQGLQEYLDENGSGRDISCEASFTPDLYWTASAPLVQSVNTGGELWISVKDPSIVRYNDRWHLFCTVRGHKRSHAVVYLSFPDWNQAGRAEQHILTCHSGYFCAPQVFYFSPQKKWYMICQTSDASWDPEYQPAYGTTDDISDPRSWSALKPLGATKPEAARAWLDFWIVCDEQKAHLFFTSLDGNMWRSETALADFPHGWSTAVLALHGDVFEASHTYRLLGAGKYLTVIEAQHGHGWRYYKSYLADRLDGEWVPLAAEKDLAFASMLNVKHPVDRWTDVISHGELLRTGFDERLEVDPQGLRMVFQGVLENERQGKQYGDIPWRLGLLERITSPVDE